jgi:hypothetical protein
MEAKKLRLGNIVKGYNGFGELIFTVHSVDDDKIAIGGWSEITDEEGSGRGYMGLKGIFEIDMTDEWAVKFGYECMVEMACVFSSESKYRIEITAKDLNTMKVNEVQNLFFAITGKDLELETNSSY